MQSIAPPPATVSQQALRELCKPRAAIQRAADASLLGSRVLGDPKSIRLLVYMNPKFGEPPVLVELPPECFDLDRRGKPRGLHGPIAIIEEPPFQESEVLDVTSHLPGGKTVTTTRQIRAINPWQNVKAEPDAKGNFLYPDEPPFTPDTYVAGPGLWRSSPQSTVGGQATAFYLVHRILVLAAKWIGHPIRLTEGPLRIAPHERLANARYDVFKPKLELGVMSAEPLKTRRLVELAKSRRSIVHELGHALQIAIHPYAAEVRGGEFFREACGDLTDLFDLLDDPHLRQQLIDETAGNPRRSSSFSRVFELGKQIVGNDDSTTRDMANDLKISDVDLASRDKTHGPSAVVAGAVLSILADVYDGLVASGQVPVEALRLAYEQIAHSWMAAVEILPNHFIVPRDIGRALVAAEKQLGGNHLEIMKRDLIRRGLLSAEDLNAPSPSLAAAFSAESVDGKLTGAQAQRFILRHTKELGVEPPMSLNVDEVLTTITGGQLIRFKVTENAGDRDSLVRNRASLVTDAPGHLIFEHRPFATDVTSADVTARLAELRASARQRGSSLYDKPKWLLAGPKGKDGKVDIYVLE